VALVTGSLHITSRPCSAPEQGRWPDAPFMKQNSPPPCPGAGQRWGFNPRTIPYHVRKL